MSAARLAAAKRKRSTFLAVALLAFCAFWRPQRAQVVEPEVLAPRLPTVLDGAPALVTPLSASEQRLDRRPAVAVSKRRYGSSLVTAIVVVGGVREHHPLSVCLRASGLEITQERTAAGASGCVRELTVRKGSQQATVALSYLDAAGTSECRLYRRIAAGAWARLRGGALSWTQLQVLDADPQRARHRLQLLIDALGRRKEL
jgi:hypothetical protein